MSKRPVLTTISSILTSLPFINTNYDSIDVAFDNTISRDGSTPNNMQADLDLDSNDLLNVATANVDTLILAGTNLSTVVAQTEANVTAAQAAETGAGVAQSNAEASAVSAASDAADVLAALDSFDSGGALVAGSNLSDLTNTATAIANLGVTATAAELNTLDGVTATVSELNTLDGITSTTAELNQLDGTTISTFGKSLIDDTDASTARATLGVSPVPDFFSHGKTATIFSSSPNTMDLTDVERNVITGASLSTNTVTLPAGDYYIEVLAKAKRDSNTSFETATLRLKQGGVVVAEDGVRSATVGDTIWLKAYLFVTLASPDTFIIEAHSSTTGDWETNAQGTSGGALDKRHIFKAWEL